MKDSTVAIDTAPLSLFRFLAVVSVIFIHYGRNIEKIFMLPNTISRGALITFFLFYPDSAYFCLPKNRGALICGSFSLRG